MLIYATATELARWITGNPNSDAAEGPANATVLLRFASLVVREATKRAYYRVDEDGFATDPATLQAFSDATCSLAGTYAALKIDPASGPAAVSQAVQSKSLGPASVTYAVDPSSATAKSDLLQGRLSTESFLILQQAGLISALVGTSHPVNLGSWNSIDG